MKNNRSDHGDQKAAYLRCVQTERKGTFLREQQHLLSIHNIKSNAMLCNNALSYCVAVSAWIETFLTTT